MKQIFVFLAFLFSINLGLAQSKTRYVTASGLNVRENENLTSKVVTTLKVGDAVELLGYKSAPTVVNGNKGSWVQVSVGSKRGYVFDFHLSENKPLANGAKTPAKVDPKTPVKPSVTPFPSAFKPTKNYTRDRADLHEYVKVQPLSNGKIAYEIYMVNGSCNEFKFRGVATERKSDLGAETDSDEQNNGFEVAEYVDDMNGKCGVTIRIGVDKGYTKHARFLIYDCKVAHCKEKTESEPLLLSK